MNNTTGTIKPDYNSDEYKAHKNYNSLPYEQLNPFTRGYIDAMFWTECNCDNEELQDKGFEDLAPETLKRIIEDCAGFDMLNKSLLDSAMRSPSYDETDQGYGLSSAGHDFWLTRNRHGAGFWDRGLGEIGDKLTEACKRYQSLDLYAGDDGKLYLM